MLSKLIKERKMTKWTKTYSVPQLAFKKSRYTHTLTNNSNDILFKTVILFKF